MRALPDDVIRPLAFRSDDELVDAIVRRGDPDAKHRLFEKYAPLFVYWTRDKGHSLSLQPSLYLRSNLALSLLPQ